MAGATGLEPAASGVTGRRSNRLSYAPAATADLRLSPTQVKQRGSAAAGEEGSLAYTLRPFSPRMCRASAGVARSSPKTSMIFAALSTSAALLGASLPLAR